MKMFVFGICAGFAVTAVGVFGRAIGRQIENQYYGLTGFIWFDRGVIAAWLCSAFFLLYCIVSWAT